MATASNLAHQQAAQFTDFQLVKIYRNARPNTNSEGRYTGSLVEWSENIQNVISDHTILVCVLNTHLSSHLDKAT